jgi:uncharacterized membrane protein
MIRADFLFTLSAVIVPPLSAVWLIFYGGLPGIGGYGPLHCMGWLMPAGFRRRRSR